MMNWVATGQLSLPAAILVPCRAIAASLRRIPIMPEQPLDHDELILRISRDLADSYDKECHASRVINR
jgi:hypothetical protein